MTTAAEVVAFLSGPDAGLSVPVTADSSLIGSALLDSVALMRLTLWIETRIGQPLDPTKVDIAADWETPDRIAAFIAAAHGGAALPPAPVRSRGSEAEQGPYVVVPYQRQYAAEVTRLRAVLSETLDPAENEAYLDWRYDRNPYRPERRIFVVLHGGQVVGIRGVTETRWQTARGVFAVPCVGDLVIAEGHRDRGVYTRLMRAIVDDATTAGYSHLFSLSASRVSAVGAMAMGFKAVAPVDVHRRRLGFVRRHLGRGRAQLIRRVPAREYPIMPRRDGDGLAIEIAPRAAAMADLVGRLPYDGRLRQHRDAAHFAWRYANPRNAYSFVYSGGETLDGYLALSRLRGSPTARTQIADWEAATPAVAARLADAMMRHCAWDEVSAWFYGLDPAKQQILREHGFTRQNPAAGVSGFSTNILVKALSDDPDRAATLGGRAVFDAASWDFRMIYSDLS